MLKEFDLDYEVCNCLKVSINDIINSIENKNVKSLRDLQEVTKAGTECRHCIFPEGDFGKIKKKIYCKTVLNEVLNG
ncbi:(2Fe-2S)-binding protein [Halarcobacter sp.]|uniref:(2Fe-2S)-binding protein n=1 Tax=Halarcobacter TaxID=2321115 RepID=UPI003A917A87